MNNTRPVPASDEAEQHVIACCLIDGGHTISRAITSGVTFEYFHSPANRSIWENIITVYSEKSSVSLEMLLEQLDTKKVLDSVGGIPYLMQITAKIPTTAHAGFFIDKLREKFVLRKLIRVSQCAMEKAYSFTGGLDEFVATVSSDISSIQNDTTSVNELSIQDAAQATITELNKQMKDGKDPKKMIKFGWADLDRLFSGMANGELVIVAARPSVGKTSFSDQVALYNAFKEGRHVAIFSLEEKTESKAAKFAQAICGHSFKHFSELTKDQQDDFLESLKEINKCKTLHVFYKQQSLMAIMARIKALRQSGKCDLVVIDYLHLMNIPGHKGDRLGAMCEATRSLKLLANELEIPIIVLSQLNRASARENREPQLFDLRDSGSIEQDADRVIFIHRPEQDKHTGDMQDITDETKEMFYQEIIQAKGRSVGTYRIGMYFKRPTTSFHQISK